MRHKVDKQESLALMADICRRKTLEEIAVNLGRTAHTVWCWKTGRSVPSKGDFEMLKTMYNQTGPAT